MTPGNVLTTGTEPLTVPEFKTGGELLASPEAKVLKEPGTKPLRVFLNHPEKTGPDEATRLLYVAQRILEADSDDTLEKFRLLLELGADPYRPLHANNRTDSVWDHAWKASSSREPERWTFLIGREAAHGLHPYLVALYRGDGSHELLNLAETTPSPGSPKEWGSIIALGALMQAERPEIGVSWLRWAERLAQELPERCHEMLFGQVFSGTDHSAPARTLLDRIPALWGDAPGFLKLGPRGMINLRDREARLPMIQTWLQHAAGPLGVQTLLAEALQTPPNGFDSWELWDGNLQAAVSQTPWCVRSKEKPPLLTCLLFAWLNHHRRDGTRPELGFIQPLLQHLDLRAPLCGEVPRSVFGNTVFGPPLVAAAQLASDVPNFPHNARANLVYVVEALCAAGACPTDKGPDGQAGIDALRPLVPEWVAAWQKNALDATSPSTAGTKTPKRQRF